MQTNASAAILLFHSTRSRPAPAPKLTSLWEAYLSARATAERSRDIYAGIAAGHAWRRWLAAFETPHD